MGLHYFPRLVAAVLILILAVDRPGARAVESAEYCSQLDRLIDELWQYDLENDPLTATWVGDHRFNDRLPAVGVAQSDRQATAYRGFLERLEAIDAAALSSGGRVNQAILQRVLRDRIAEHKFQAHLTPITSRSGFHIQFPDLRQRTPLDTVDDYQDFIARLAAFDQYAAGHVELMRAGIAAERTLPAAVLRGYEPSVETHIVDQPEQSLLYEPFKKFPNAIPADQRESLRAAAKVAIRDGVVAGYRRFRDFLRDEYAPHARGSVGASALPGGREFYRYRVRRFTTLDATPEEVHAQGLAEVARIRGEMDEIIRRVEFDGDFAAFVEHLRSDPRFYADSPDALMKEAAAILKRMDGRLPQLFGKLPRTPYGLRPVPDYIAPRTTSAYYMPPTGDGAHAGFFYLNTYDLKSRPLYALEALALHEAVPGHHLQLALQQEIDDLPPFRRFSQFTAFIEGWALYSERLGLETGFYEDPYSDFGRLSMEIWRACRLVVDTGIHYLGWTRRQAIDYMAENSALSLHNIEAEVDRYIGWPGQALAYKMGELKIRELRKTAEQELGPRFDLRQFHDVVLSGGAVPLDVLETTVTEWVASVGAPPQ